MAIKLFGRMVCYIAYYEKIQILCILICKGGIFILKTIKGTVNIYISLCNCCMS